VTRTVVLQGLVDLIPWLGTPAAERGKTVRRGRRMGETLGRKDTTDIFTEVSRRIDKWPWFLLRQRAADPRGSRFAMTSTSRVTCI
jgi:hypothetical protein